MLLLLKIEHLLVGREPIITVPDDVVVVCHLHLELLELLLLAHTLSEERFVIRVLLVNSSRLRPVLTALFVVGNLDAVRGVLSALLSRYWSTADTILTLLVLAKLLLGVRLGRSLIGLQWTTFLLR